jgi:adenylate kinase
MMTMLISGKEKPLVLILLGPPGSGKGTQAGMLHEKFNLPHISTGDILRDHIRRSTQLGLQAKEYIDRGQLVPDPLIMDLLFNRVAEKDCAAGYILDGFPRTLAQAEALQEHLKNERVFIINLDIKDEEVIERLTKRLTCQQCGTPYHLIYTPPRVEGVCDKCAGLLVQRSDDTKEVIEKRLKVYHMQTSPLIHYYASLKLLHTVNCLHPREKIFFEILKICQHSEIVSKP